MSQIVTVRDLTFYYEEGAKPALDNITLEIEEGSFVAVLGHNGSGKSTLAKLIGGILIPAVGKVTVCGLDAAREDTMDRLREQVGMVFQNPDNQIVSSVVEEDVAFAPENLGVPHEELLRRVKDALEAVGMSHYATHSTSLLSGGQKQRIAIAGILAMHPRMIVLDEPTAMLDPKGRRSIMKVLHRLVESGMTVIHITHHMDEAVEADRVVVIDDGKILLDGTPHEVFAKEDILRKAGLTVPQSVALMHALREQGIDVPEAVLTVDECVAVLEKLLREVDA